MSARNESRDRKNEDLKSNVTVECFGILKRVTDLEKSGGKTKCTVCYYLNQDFDAIERRKAWVSKIPIDETFKPFQEKQRMVYIQRNKDLDNLTSLPKISVCPNCGGPHHPASCPKNQSDPDLPLGDMQPATFASSVTGKAAMMSRLRPGNTLKFSNLTTETSEADLYDLIHAHDMKPSNVRVIRDKNSGISRGYAFVSFNTEREMDAALQLFDKIPYAHIILQVTVPT